MGCILNFNKSSSIRQGAISDIITYKLDITNVSDNLAENIILKDLLHPDLRFVLGSVKIDHISSPKSNIISGVSIGDLKKDENRVLTFDAEIINRSSEYVENQAIAEFRYCSCGTYQCDVVYSCVNRILIKNPSLKLTKEVDKKRASLGDILNYTIVLTNTGDLDLENLQLRDTISNSVKLIDGSFTIDGRVVNSVELEKGVMLDNLPIKEVKIIKYSVIVQSGGANCKLCNESVVRYAYTLPNGLCMYKESNKSKVCVDMSISSFRQVNIEEYLTIPCQKPDIETINDIKATVKISKCTVVKTPVAVSSEGQRLSGYKLVVHGFLNQVIEYVACEPTQSLHSAHYSVPFSDYIILPSDFIPGSKVHVEGLVEDIYYNVVDSKCFFKNITLLLLAKIALCK